MNKYFRVFCLSIALIFMPINCFADGGGPILLLINSVAFTVGQFWILSTEFLYLFLLLKVLSLSNWKLLKITLFMNLLSTFCGAIIFPLLLAVVTIPGLLHMNTTWGGLLMALGTWVVGDNSPYSEVAMGVSIAGFIITFILTVWIECKYLKYLSKKQEIIFSSNILKHCIFFNIII